MSDIKAIPDKQCPSCDGQVIRTALGEECLDCGWSDPAADAARCGFHYWDKKTKRWIDTR